jgi:uncharacterized membrane protein
MIRKLLTGIAALTLMTGAAFAQDRYDHDYGDRVAANTVKGGVGGAGVGALIGCLVTIPIGCAPGAAVGAAVGGGGGAFLGAASTRSRDYPPPRDYSSDDR